MITVHHSSEIINKKGCCGNIRSKAGGGRLQRSSLSCWDPVDFQKQTSNNKRWKESSKPKKIVTRLQDISIGLFSAHHFKSCHSDANNDKGCWPFESSPCAMFGGKNTKSGCEAMNKEIFRTDFGGNAKEHRFEDDDSFCGDESSDFHPSGNTKADVDLKSTSNPSTAAANSSANKATGSSYLSSDIMEEIREAEEAEAIAQKQRRKPARAASFRIPSKRNEGSSGGMLRRKSHKEDLGTETYHGNATGAASQGRAPNRRGAPTRSKSINGSLGAGDDLGAATLHGKSSVSRVRTKRRTSTTEVRKTKTDRRPMMKRAMSTANVKRPEEYGPKGNSGFKASMPSASAAAAAVVAGDNAVASRGDRLKRKPSRRILGMASHQETGEQDEDRNHKNQQDLMRYGLDNAPKKRPDPRRDLLVLLREQKSITQKDLMDKENRRILHFLILEHKMGISQKELYKAIREEREKEEINNGPSVRVY